MASSSSFSRMWNYDVFISFRGEDTRKTFVDHLYSALVQWGIHTYKDDEELPRGEIIRPALLKAIEGSWMAVIVFSKNYADSSWCLDELAHIMKCMDERGLIVMPIFYDVDPSDVRKQNGKYGEAFAKHEIEKKDKVESWRKALVDAGNISGWDVKHVANGHESKGIKKMVNNISERLFSETKNVHKDLIGMKTRLQDLKAQLDIGSGGVWMVGIWGVGGGGKTTLASSVYDEISNRFEGCCFLGDIQEQSIKYGLEKLQEKILCGVLKQKQVEVDGVEEGKLMIRSRLWHKRVLIVLDDVNNLNHLNALAGSHDWFGEGSRILITTRDNHILNVHKVDVIHNISLLNYEEGIELFCKHAHRDYRPKEGYERLSEHVVLYASGLPLALIVLGSFLCDKDINEWKSALARLKEIPDTDIVEKLKISYDGLTREEKELFLDIACFFRGEKKNYAIEILDACGLHPVIGIKVLIQKALITISDGMFSMHDLIQEMGHYIVRGENPRNPEKHTRVWQVEEVLSICAMDPTTELDRIIAIRIISDMYDPLPRHNNHVVANMKKLRWIEWKGHHASSLPTNFPQSELCCLVLNGGHQKQLWNGFKANDFSGLPNLERFHLNKSPRLEEIHSSVKRLKKLVVLLITSCSNLKMFPSITGIEKLETLSLSKCIKLSKSGNEVASYRQYCTDFFVTCLTCGRSDDDGEYNSVNQPLLLHNSLNGSGLQFISTGLKKLVLSNCHLGDEHIKSNVWELSNLQELDLSQNIFSQLNFSFLQLPRLKWLDISLCNRLVEFSELPSSIAILRADYCYALETVGDISNCKWLWKVSFFGSNKVGPLGDKVLLDSMRQGNAIEHHYLSLALEHQVRMMYVSSLAPRSRFILQLPQNWYNDFCGFLIYCVIEYQEPFVTITIEQEVNESVCNDDQNELFVDRDSPTYIGYVSFSSLMHNTWLNPQNSMISFFLGGKFEVELVPRKSKGGHQIQTIQGASDNLEFWDEEREDRKTFTIQRAWKSSIDILWCPT
ncbi:toll/interleukin-1 receptor (TIR) domain-containing protein [Artemisia annua]|uniref:Toll/interleukin-1 receptor (TIR) domain-containing protein n=1 Tax=Artemisia annua TaxID=35608 RepID=A0A2U1MKK1_ARTAN|nr:toll/interleukin-1 receptor (TIR) domain-containing protein [Artemisia annua]